MKFPSVFVVIIAIAASANVAFTFDETDEDRKKEAAEINRLLRERNQKKLSHASPAEWAGTVDRKTYAEIGQPVIANEKQWKKVWPMLHGKDVAVPKVDFKKDILWIEIADANDPNQRSTEVLLSKEGVMMVNTMTTLIGFQPSRKLKFEIFRIPRKGIRKYLSIDPTKRRLSLNELK